MSWRVCPGSPRVQYNMLNTSWDGNRLKTRGVMMWFMAWRSCTDTPVHNAHTARLLSLTSASAKFRSESSSTSAQIPYSGTPS